MARVDRERGKQVIVLTRDEGLQRRVAEALAGSPAYRVLQRATGIEPIYDLGVQGALDAILLDYRLHPEDPLVPVRLLHQRVPDVPVVVLVESGDDEFTRRALLAGAKTFLPLGLPPADLVHTLDDLTASAGGAGAGGRGRLVTVFSLKGGVGRTLVAVNLAVALRARIGAPVALVDGDLAYGDVELALNLKPQHTIADLVSQVDTLEPDVMDHALARHASGVRVLAAADNAAAADRVQPRHLSTVVQVLRSQYPWVLVDTGAWADPRLEPILESSDVILLVTTPEIASLRATRVFLQIAREQNYPPDKIRLVVNRADMTAAIPEKQIRSSLGLVPFAVLSDDPALATFSLNRGIPVVQSHGRKPLARGLTQMAEALVSEVAAKAGAQGRGGLFGQRRRA